MSRKGYIIAEAKVDDVAAFELYRPLSEAAIAQYGGRFVIRGGDAEVLEGAWSPPQRLIVIEFDSVEQARRFYCSDEYQAARKLRENAGVMNMLVAGGVESLV
ncbi:MAG: DUF1330 domain-containing protein [Bacteroidota bacterium]